MKTMTIHLTSAFAHGAEVLTRDAIDLSLENITLYHIREQDRVQRAERVVITDGLRSRVLKDQDRIGVQP